MIKNCCISKSVIIAGVIIGLAFLGYIIWYYILLSGSPLSGNLPPGALTPTPYTLSDGITKYCVTRAAEAPPESYFLPNKTDEEFNAFKNANLPGVTIVTAPAAGTNWVAGSCCDCNTRCGTEADGNCGTRNATRSDGSCTSGCTPEGCCTDCGSGYMCSWDGGKACYTMCCTGGGCPSWACTVYCSSRGGVTTYCTCSWGSVPCSCSTLCRCVNGATYNCCADTCASC